ncbi:hypothetical protein RIF23_13905 [Lipingzhangella sp. LS1_29]|uniref:Uncharacterized protein n=1 Tax=Lipingzhangella rawalii TaxID=2055835 RepID=A0ABU2H7V4_9ACTN|nr:hypothetical protein [Lipingzhangella rawalii]MDS1271393.1 hypothetical protein [Lipingzhangella rawalii]
MPEQRKDLQVWLHRSRRFPWPEPDAVVVYPNETTSRTGCRGLFLVAPIALGTFVLLVIWVEALVTAGSRGSGGAWWYATGTLAAMLVASGALIPALYRRRLHHDGAIALDSAGLWQIQNERAELLPWTWIRAVAGRRSAGSQALRRRLRHRAAGTFADVTRDRAARESRQLWHTPDTLEVYLTEEGRAALAERTTGLRPAHHDEQPARPDLPQERIRYPFLVWDHCQAAVDYVVTHHPELVVDTSQD